MAGELAHPKSYRERGICELGIEPCAWAGGERGNYRSLIYEDLDFNLAGAAAERVPVVDQVITAAAIRDHDGTIYSAPPPARHHDIIRIMVEKGRPTPITGDQGFVNENGVFHNRIQGAAEALRRKQIVKLKWPPNLYSEDLW